MLLNSADLDRFERDGYLLVRELLLWDEDLQPVLAEYEDVLDQLLERWHQEGRLASTYPGLPFGERLTKAVAETRAPYCLDFDISLPQADLSESTPMHLGPAVFGLLRSPRLLDVVEQFVGPEIYSNPVQHTRIKLPEAELPTEAWTGLSGPIALHQDLGVISDEADDTEMLTVWFPVTESTLENGCLAVVPGSHRRGLALHCRSGDPRTLNQVCIPDKVDMGEQVPLEMHPGDVLFMHRKTCHAGLPNRGRTIRWSFDLRYHPIGQPTGRPWFPGFVARSQAHPETELHDAGAWADSWRAARHALAQGDDVAFNRWSQDDPRCA